MPDFTLPLLRKLRKSCWSNSLQQTFPVTLLLCLSASISYGQVSGTVFKDFNANGTKDNTATFNEVGMPGVAVNATKPDGSFLTVTYTGGGSATNSTGGYAVTGGTLGQIRLEFVLPDAFTFASKGATGGTTILFPTTATQNLAVNTPDDYWDNINQPIPQLITPCYVNGAISNPSSVASTGIVQIANDQNGISGLTKVEVAKAAEVGAVWGEAYQRSNDRFFFSSFLKRHVGFGPKGIGGVYIAEKSGSAYDITASFDLQGVIPSNSAIAVNMGTVTRVTTPTTADNYLATASAGQPARDLDAFAKVGTMSYGDIDIDEANKKLFMTNLNQNSLMVLDIAGGTASLNNATAATLGTLLKTYAIASLSGVPTCTNGNLRIWGLKIYKGRGYLGAICDAMTNQASSNLKGYILSFDPTNVAAGLTTEITLTMTYRDPTDWLRWRPWINTFAQTNGASPDIAYFAYCQPILSDIEFNENGDMTIAMMDRTGNQFGVQNYKPESGSTVLVNGVAFGDILQARKNVAGTWVMEGTSGTIPPNFTTSDDQQTGYGNVTGSKGEYFNDRSGDGSPEGIMGSLTKIMGSTHLVAPVVDPYPANGTTGAAYFDTGGMEWYNSTTGTWDQHARLYGPNSANAVDFGKAIGLGDIEAALSPAPIEIGNRVWNDTDNDGIQDAGEASLAGITVILCDSLGTAIAGATATTDANGNYFFSTATGSNTASAIYGLPVNFNTKYILKFPTASGALLISTKANTGSNDFIDTDADATGKITFKTGTSGQNNHSFDVGYYACVKPNGSDIIGANAICSNIGTAALSATPGGGTWSFLDGPSTASVTGSNAGAMSSIGIYRFIYTLNGCADTVSVETKNCAKGSLGDFIWKDVNNNGIQDLPSEKGVKGVIVQLLNGSTNAVLATDTTDALGIYSFIGLNSGSYKVKIVLSSLPDTCQISTKQDIATGSGNDTNDSDFNPITGESQVVIINTLGTGLAKDNPTIDAALVLHKEVDLALKKSINTKIAQSGDVLTYTLKIWNESNTGATGVEVTDSIATSVQFQAGSFAASRGSAGISGHVIKWNIGNIAANGDTVTLTYQVKATQEGVHFNTAEISKTNEQDIDSTPGNGQEEDDIDRQCFTIPFTLCKGEKVEVTIPAKYTNVLWFINGGSTPVATGNIVLLGDVGVYTFTATYQTCPAGGCCPIIIEEGSNCCPPDLCIPFIIKQTKKGKK